jgi:ABC-type transport system substrate-binding protein
MKFSRLGEGLWSEWDGNDFPAESEDSIIYYTLGHPDTEHEVVRRALASAIQRDGTADTIFQAFTAIEEATITQGQAGRVDGDYELTYYDPDISMYDEDDMGTLLDVTIVEITRGN